MELHISISLDPSEYDLDAAVAMAAEQVREWLMTTADEQRSIDLVDEFGVIGTARITDGADHPDRRDHYDLPTEAALEVLTSRRVPEEDARQMLSHAAETGEYLTT